MQFQGRQRPAEVLFVEGNPGDVLLTKQALGEGEKFNLHVVNDGEKALKFLNRSDEYANAPVPDLLFLDLNLPKKDGRQVLEVIKNDPELKRIPVVILTTSTSVEDIAKCYELHANCYVTKPTGLTQFNEVIKTIEKFWLSIAKLPPVKN